MGDAWLQGIFAVKTGGGVAQTVAPGRQGVTGGPLVDKLPGEAFFLQLTQVFLDALTAEPGEQFEIFHRFPDP